MLIDSDPSLTLINLDLFYQLPYHIRQGARYPLSNLQVHLADKSRGTREKNTFTTNHDRKPNQKTFGICGTEIMATMYYR